ncbi:MAG: hypothetical protein M3Y59_16950 [Myxococcota bacterium]|nr:hypothetical protein [Myxococcota bacterium]
MAAQQATRFALPALAGAVVVGALLRLHLAWTDDGIYWPDEIYQSLEPAHRLVFGYGLVAWEFVEGARNWALPGLVALFLKGFALVGWEDPAQSVRGLKSVFALCGGATVWAVWRLARALGADESPAVAGAWAFALIAPAIYFAPRGMSEPSSALPLVLGLALALPTSSSDRRLVGGASLLGMATLLRLQNGVFCAGLIAVLLARRAWRQAGIAFAVLCGWGVLFGLLDKLTWGHWFHSAAVYLKFNLIDGKASQWGTAEPGYYLQFLYTSMPAAAVLLAALALFAWQKARGLLLIALAFLALHSLVPHKELRFVFALLPLGCALAAIGLGRMAELGRGWLQVPEGEPLPTWMRAGPMSALLLACLFSAATHRSLTFGQLGQYLREKPRASAYDDFGGVNRLLLAAHDREDLCGLKVESVHAAWMGGQTYLHRQVPLYPHSGPPREGHRFNYAITASAWAREGQVVAAEGGSVLVRFPWACVPDSGYSERLP